MPGPGGGGFGGGGGRGFGGGGGFSGGGRGFGGHNGGFGGMHGPHGGMHRPHGMFFGPRPHGSGCLGGILGIMLIPFIVIMVIVIMIFGTVGSSFSELSRGGSMTYDENTFQDYANEQYAAIFGGSEAYEDNILLVVLTEDDEYYGYAYIAWVGDHISPDINHLFGSDGTELGAAFRQSINSSSYKYSLDSDLAYIVGTMENEVLAEGLDSSFTCQEERTDAVSSRLINKTGMELTESTVNTALSSFTEATGIPMAIVVDDAEDVFGKSLSATTIIVLVIVAVAVILLIILVINLIRKKKKPQGEDRYYDTGSSYTNSNNNYDSGYDDRYRKY